MLHILYTMFNFTKQNVSNTISCLGQCSQPKWLSRMSVRLVLGGRGVKPCQVGQHSYLKIKYEIFFMIILCRPLIQEGQLSECAQVQVNRLEDYACTGKSVVRKTDQPDKTLIVLTGPSNQTEPNTRQNDVFMTMQTVNSQISFHIYTV